MTSTSGLEDLNGLLEQRAQYERWIAQLNAKRDQTPPHVYERVRADYAARLEAVMEQLRSRENGVQATASTLQERVASLTNQETARRDARAEIELRAMVGEYTADRANEELSVCDADIGRLESERSGAAAELHRLQEILTLVRQPTGTGATGAAPRPAPAPASAAPPPAPPPSRPLGAPPASPEAEAVDELAFLNSVMDRAQDSPAPLTSPPPGAPAPTAPRIEDIPLVTSLEPSDRAEAQTAGREGMSLRQAAGTPAFLKGMPTEQVKTLKCQECGTMNYPTEWYCERCGGELAAM